MINEASKITITEYDVVGWLPWIAHFWATLPGPTLSPLPLKPWEAQARVPCFKPSLGPKGREEHLAWSPANLEWVDGTDEEGSQTG